MDLGAPSSYLTLAPGLDVFSRDGEKVGDVRQVLSEPELDIFDGVVIDGRGVPGGPRLAEAEQIEAIYERGVVLGLAAADVGRLPEPDSS